MPPIRHKPHRYAKPYSNHWSSFFLSTTFTNALILEIARSQQHLYPERPPRNSRPSGREYLDNLFKSDPRCQEVLGISVSRFQALETWLRVHGGLTDPTPRGHVYVDEQIAIFLWIVRHGASFSEAAEYFQHSKYTIQKYFNKVATSLVRLYKTNVTLPPADVPTHPKIRENPKLFPYFKDCIGAGDGTHIPAKVPLRLAKRFRDRKGEISQNVFATCDFSFRLTYVLPGWEGSAHDGRVLDDALLSKGFSVPYGKFYLMDAGYALRPGFLTPYREVRYHLKEQWQARSRPETKEELFNLRHAQGRNMIEHLFGVLKKRFKILRQALEYALSLQVKVVRAIAAIYNFIRDEVDETEFEQTFAEESQRNETSQQMEEGTMQVQDDAGMRAFREQLAERMWEDYQAYLRRHRH